MVSCPICSKDLGRFLLHSAAQYSLGKEPPTKLPSLTTTFDDVAAVDVRYLVATLGPLIQAKLKLVPKSF